MKISARLYRFENESSLVVVSGDKSAEIYLAKGGNISKIDSFRIEKPSFSDREGFFLRAGKGMTFGSGAVEEIDEREIAKKFVRGLAGKISSLAKIEKVDFIYLFLPERKIFSLPEELGSEEREKIRLKIKGNFSGSHPLKIVRMIDAEMKKPLKDKVPAKRKALEILTRKIA